MTWRSWSDRAASMIYCRWRPIRPEFYPTQWRTAQWPKSKQQPRQSSRSSNLQCSAMCHFNSQSHPHPQNSPEEEHDIPNYNNNALDIAVLGRPASITKSHFFSTFREKKHAPHFFSTINCLLFISAYICKGGAAIIPIWV